MQFLTKTRPILLILGALTGLTSVTASPGAPHVLLHPGLFHPGLRQQSAIPQTSPPADKPKVTTPPPLLLLLVQRPAKAVLQRDDPTPRFTDTLRSALTDTSKFEILVYSPDHASIKRALLEKTLAVVDLVSPIKPEALGRIAHAIGAHYALLLSPTFDRQGFSSDLNFLSDSDGNEWRTVLQDRVVMENFQGRRHLKPPAVIALAVDAVTGRIGTPTHLADGMKIAPDRLIRMEPKKQHEKIAKTESNKQQDDSTGTQAQSTTAGSSAIGSSGTGGTIAKSAQAGASTGTGRSTSDGANQTPNGVATPQRSDSRAAQNSKAKGSSPRSGAPSTATLRRTPFSETASDLTTPAPRPDYGDTAQHYQTSGDLASAILFWRRAIDVDPYNADLRRRLIQAYVERHMMDAAREEAARSLSLLPEDSGLTRLYADTLAANGDMPGALKVYRDLAQRAPHDVIVQVSLADALLADNQFAAAVDAYQAAARIDPHSPLPHRRLARVYVGRADSDLQQYGESLKEITLARSLTPSGDTASYESDYVPLMLRLDTRLHDLTGTLQDLYETAVQGKKTTTELLRATTDLRERVTALADYLDALPPAAGQDEAHAHYTQAAALLLQGVGTFRRYLTTSSANLEDARGPMQVARMDTLGALTIAGKRLAAAHTAARGNN